jgi:putative transposase
MREVELILAARGIVVSYESIRQWGLRFGRMFANSLKRRRHNGTKGDIGCYNCDATRSNPGAPGHGLAAI